MNKIKRADDDKLAKRLLLNNLKLKGSAMSNLIII